MASSSFNIKESKSLLSSYDDEQKDNSFDLFDVEDWEIILHLILTLETNITIDLNEDSISLSLTYIDHTMNLYSIVLTFESPDDLSQFRLLLGQ